MEIFSNNDGAYVSWLEHHPDGYVLNLSTGGKHRSMLHTARCRHLYPPDPTRVHTGSYQKACAADREKLERWGPENGYAVMPCPDCGT